MIIGVDIDGVFTNEKEGHDYGFRTPNLENITKINNLRSKFGHIIILYTSRFEEDRKVTEAWLFLNGVDYDRLIMDKPRFDLYIGDEVRRPEEL
jgi:uncharacterized HAD superfamily protein